ncbi:MAG TPA: TolC family protein [Thermoanaerobaculia bacterium]|nr:TolC family protein [Thermoanaerobaculia bacterium]
MKRVFFLLLIARPLFAIDFNDRRAVVAAATEKHPALTRLRAEADAAREAVGAAGALPNPMLMAGVQDKQIDLTDDEMMTMYMVGASQRLVRPAKRESQRRAAELTASAAEKQLDSARAAIERDVLLAWYEVATVDAQLAVIAQVRVMIEAIVAAARVRYEVGSALQADVIRAQLEGSDLEHEILTLRGTRRTALARLLPLLELPLHTDVPALTIPADAAAIDIGHSSTPPHDHPAVAALEAEVARAEEEIRLIELEAKPDVDLEAQYGVRRVERDMFSVTARIELPLRLKQTVEPRVREAMLRRDAIRARIAEVRRELTQALGEAVVAHEQANDEMKFHEQVLVPQAQLAFESTLAAYETGRTSFDAILVTQSDYLRRRLEEYDFLLRHAQAVTNYEALRNGATAAGAMSGSGSATRTRAVRGTTATAPAMGSM